MNKTKSLHAGLAGEFQNWRESLCKFTLFLFPLRVAADFLCDKQDENVSLTFADCCRCLMVIIKSSIEADILKQIKYQ